ncbi:MAG: dihydrodipicolinate reductase [Spirochaetes bacterium]|nr:MAG: dihydrodipicolinate reductase [Spirochaetota bacterium]
MRLGIFGRGRLGGAIATEIGRYTALPEAIELVWTEGREPGPRPRVEVVVDASAASAVETHLEWAMESGTDMVVATTGWSIPNLEEKVGGKIGLLLAPNLSTGVALMRRLAAMVGAYAAMDPESDLGIVEHHHKKKADSPSGTAITLAEAVEKACPRYQGWNMGSYDKDRINIASLRSGFEVGRHEIVLDAALESLVITHRAKDRRVFAAGAMKAATWVWGRKGVYTMEDFASEVFGG